MLECDANNPYVNQFKKAASLLKKDSSLDMKIKIVTDKSCDLRRYIKPSSTELAVLIPSTGESDEP